MKTLFFEKKNIFMLLQTTSIHSIAYIFQQQEQQQRDPIEIDLCFEFTIRSIRLINLVVVSWESS